MKIFFTALLFLPILLYSANDEKTISLKKINEPIQIDGVIDDAWALADSVDNFFQLSPFYSKAPSRRTYAKVLTTDNSLYCLIVSFDERKNIQSTTGKLDDFSGDVVSIMFDTFGDKRSAYKFAVSASGIRMDCRLLDDARNRDYSWDGIWFSDAKIYDWGFVVEMEIPYKSIQYNEELNFWGLDFDRWRPENSEDLYWCVYEQNEGQRISKFGKLLFEDFKPSIKGLNLEFYPTAFGKITYIEDGKYKVDPNAGLDIFYNPSPQLTLQVTANPDFAQIEADPYSFNISRYESYFSEKRPFFTQGNEIFMPSGKQRNTGFYSPLELFYSRRVGKILPDGTEVPITFGTKAFGRISDWEYGGFVARTPGKDYELNGTSQKEPEATFISGRIKKTIGNNSNLGVLFVSKQSMNKTDGVIDIDGALRESNWQLSYQLARSINNSEGGYAASAGFTKISNSWLTYLRGRTISRDFNVDQVGFVPWKGTTQIVGITGPIWYPQEGAVSQILFYTGPIINREEVDKFTDLGWIFGYNMEFRDNWGFEIELDIIKAKDSDVKYDNNTLQFSSWYNISPDWSGNFNCGYEKTYNFSRNYLSFYSWAGIDFSWKTTDILKLGTSFDMWIEGNPSNDIEEITYNARPWISITPVNDLNFYVYVDNLYLRSTEQMERIFLGVLFSYQFSPKSWIYLALNEARSRNNIDRIMSLTDRVSVFKVKYLYYL
jgi:hypothetical protein